MAENISLVFSRSTLIQKHFKANQNPNLCKYTSNNIDISNQGIHQLCANFVSFDSLKNFSDITYLCFPFGIILLAIIPYTVNKGKRNECKDKEKPQPIHLPTALQSRGDLLAANALSFYTFPRDVRSHNVYTMNCLVHKRKLYANGVQIHPRTLR